MTGAAGTEESAAVLTTYGGALAEAGAAAHAGSRDEMGERVVRTFLKFWEDPELRPHLVSVFRSAAAGEEGAAQMRAFMTAQLFAQVGDTLGSTPMTIEQVADTLGVPALHLNAAAAQVTGVIMLRYVLGMEPMASAPPEELLAVLAPTIQRYLVP